MDASEYLFLYHCRVRVELACLVGGTVVVRIADRRHAAVGQALDTTIYAECARHFVDHPSSAAFFRY